MSTQFNSDWSRTTRQVITLIDAVWQQLEQDNRVRLPEKSATWGADIDDEVAAPSLGSASMPIPPPQRASESMFFRSGPTSNETSYGTIAHCGSKSRERTVLRN